MRKHLIILIVLVIGFVVFQGFIGWNHKLEVSADEKELAREVIEIIEKENEIEVVYKESNNTSKGYIQKPIRYQTKRVLGLTLPDYSKLSSTEIIVNIGFILGIVFCLINIKRKSKEIVIDNVEAVKGLILYLIYSIILIIGTVVSAMFTIMYPEFWVITLTIIIYSIKELICITDILFYKD